MVRDYRLGHTGLRSYLGCADTGKAALTEQLIRRLKQLLPGLLTRTIVGSRTLSAGPACLFELSDGVPFNLSLISFMLGTPGQSHPRAGGDDINQRFLWL